MAITPPLSQAVGYGVIIGLGFLFAYASKIVSMGMCFTDMA